MIYTKLPDTKSKWFIKNGRGGRKDFGGVSPCATGNKEISQGNVLNNCVGLAWGMAAMYENDEAEKVGFIKSSTYPQDAGSWYNGGQPSKWDKHERGTTPRAGSIICYTKHVAFVNEVKLNGDLVCISSAWGSSNPKGCEFVDVKKSDGYAWRSALAGDFQGFIYLKKGGSPDPDPEPDPQPQPQPSTDIKVGDKVKIVGYGNARANGTGWRAGGIGWIRYVIKIHKGQKYPYQIGFKSGITTGFYQKEALKKIE